jgi:hypothetical protein
MDKLIISTKKKNNKGVDRIRIQKWFSGTIGDAI